MIYAPALLNELEKRTDKNIYCFGAGKALDSFIDEFQDYKLQNRIKGIADNNPNVVAQSIKKNQRLLYTDIILRPTAVWH